MKTQLPNPATFRPPGSQKLYTDPDMDPESSSPWAPSRPKPSAMETDRPRKSRSAGNCAMSLMGSADFLPDLAKR